MSESLHELCLQEIRIKKNTISLYKKGDFYREKRFRSKNNIYDIIIVIIFNIIIHVHKNNSIIKINRY